MIITSLLGLGIVATWRELVEHLNSITNEDEALTDTKNEGATP